MSLLIEIPDMENASFAKGNRRPETIFILKTLVEKLEGGLDDSEEVDGEEINLRDNCGDVVGTASFVFWDSSMYEPFDLNRAWQSFKNLCEMGITIEHSGCDKKTVTTVAEWYEWDETSCENSWMEMSEHETAFPSVEDILAGNAEGVTL